MTDGFCGVKVGDRAEYEKTVTLKTSTLFARGQRRHESVAQ